jgi:hypothetical protein
LLLELRAVELVEGCDELTWIFFDKKKQDREPG